MGYSRGLHTSNNEFLETRIIPCLFAIRSRKWNPTDDDDALMERSCAPSAGFTRNVVRCWLRGTCRPEFSPSTSVFPSSDATWAESYRLSCLTYPWVNR